MHVYLTPKSTTMTICFTKVRDKDINFQGFCMMSDQFGSSCPSLKSLTEKKTAHCTYTMVKITKLITVIENILLESVQKKGKKVLQHCDLNF